MVLGKVTEPEPNRRMRVNLDRAVELLALAVLLLAVERGHAVWSEIVLGESRSSAIDLHQRRVGVHSLVEHKAPVEVELQPVHKAVYLLFLAHPEGIEFKRLRDHRQELLGYYLKTARMMDREKIEESVDKLIDPLDNAINEKCSRIKKVFLDLMDEYRASYYIIGSHTKKHIAGRVWYERLKIITLPREMVEMRSEK